MTFAAALVDDVERIKLVMSTLHEAGLTVKSQKCQLGMMYAQYLGHVEGGGCIYPLTDKVSAVRNFPTPVTKKHERSLSFLCLAGYHRQFIPDFAELAAPSTDLMQKSEPNKLQSLSECQCAFDNLKARLCCDPILRGPDFSKPFIAQCDA